MDVIPINEDKRAIANILKDLNDKADQLESLVIVYALKNDKNIYHSLYGDSNLKLLGLLQCANMEILDKMAGLS